jgi:hypothetical protein
MRRAIDAGALSAYAAQVRAERSGMLE